MKIWDIGLEFSSSSSLDSDEVNILLTDGTYKHKPKTRDAPKIPAIKDTKTVLKEKPFLDLVFYEDVSLDNLTKHCFFI